MVCPRSGAQHASIPIEMHGRPTVGQVIRAKRREQRLTLERLAALTGCAKSYLSSIENDRRGPPGDERLERIEQALGLRAGELLNVARWQSTPDVVQQEFAELRQEQRLARRLVSILGGTDIGTDGHVRGALGEAHRSGELQRLVDRLSGSRRLPLDAVLPMEVPIINRVRAGYPSDFTDLGYPARIADEYVRVPDLTDPDAFAARVVGDSMEPEYREGDIVVFGPARGVRSGTDCFARLGPDHGSTFRRAFFETGQGGAELIRLQPINPKYPPLVLPRERVAGLYAAVSVTRNLG